MSNEYDIGFGFLGNGLTVWNRKDEVGGDYKTIAHIAPDRSVTFYDAGIPDDVKARILEVARTSNITISATQDQPVFTTPACEQKATETTPTYKYWRRSAEHHEEVTFDAHDAACGTCCVNIRHLLDGFRTFPCTNGSEYKLTRMERLAILEAVEKERSPYTEAPLKTLDGWEQSCIGSFGDYAKPGDLVDEAIVEQFVNSLPPHLMRSTCTQAGEPHSTEVDMETGKYRGTWTTFHRESGKTWRFDGTCFSGENIHRGGETSYLRREIQKARQEIEGLNGMCVSCKLLDTECNGTVNKTWTGCVSREARV